jgi:Ulp1 family protease
MGGRFTITGTSLDTLRQAVMSYNTSIDALLALGIPDATYTAIQWAYTDFFTTLALTANGYDPSIMTRSRQRFNLFRASATLTLIPISQNQHFTLVVIDHMQRQIRGYDSLYGNPEYDNAIANNIRTIRQLLDDEALALGLTDYADNWTIIHDAARREGLPRQINGVDCGR